MNRESTVECGVIRKGKWHTGRSATGVTSWAFTLIELLAVIAIIGLLSGLVVGLSGIATAKSREARIRGEHHRLSTAIDAYKAEMGNFPPDNPDRTTWPDNKSDSYHDRAGRNPLYYELSGAVFGANGFTPASRNFPVLAVDLKKQLGVDGIENSSRQAREIPFRGVAFKNDQYAALRDNTNVFVLAVPMKGPHQFNGKGNSVFNPWFYDATSTNRHNSETFDLWAEYMVGNKTNIFGNWKE
jgi:prepilin-type N-terminal cleavage/methylation domain-containing protein